MTSDPIGSRLDNYRLLIGKVDTLAGKIKVAFHEQITCRKGCDGCCRHLSLLPVEAAALSAALRTLDTPEQEHISTRARRATPEGPCPLLENGSCLLYEARPLICRTHGMPLLVERDGQRQIDFCPLNFTGLTSLPGEAVMDLERLNEVLVAVDALFRNATPALPERLTIAEALLLERNISRKSLTLTEPVDSRAGERL